MKGKISIGKIAEIEDFQLLPKILLKLGRFHYEKIMKFKNGPLLPGAGRTRAWHHHGSYTLTSPRTVLLGKMAYHTKKIRRECRTKDFELTHN